MAKVIICVGVLCCLLAAPLWAEGGKFGLGVVLGEPTGLAAKLWVGETTALDGVVAWSFVNNPSLTIHADYLFHFFDVIQVSKGRLPLYVGIGASVSISGNPDVGIRIPFGLSYIVASAPLDLFLEVGPLFLLVPETTFDFSGGIGIRFYFPARKK